VPEARHDRAGVERVMGFCSDEAYQKFTRSTFVPAAY
jgi:hypothetical protein